MAIVPKPSGSVCIYVDLKPLNESVMRDVRTPHAKGRHYAAPVDRIQ